MVLGLLPHRADIFPEEERSLTSSAFGGVKRCTLARASDVNSTLHDQPPD